jgi:hypothetical protein
VDHQGQAGFERRLRVMSQKGGTVVETVTLK